MTSPPAGVQTPVCAFTAVLEHKAGTLSPLLPADPRDCSARVAEGKQPREHGPGPVRGAGDQDAASRTHRAHVTLSTRCCAAPLMAQPHEHLAGQAPLPSLLPTGQSFP